MLGRQEISIFQRPIYIFPYTQIFIFPLSPTRLLPDLTARITRRVYCKKLELLTLREHLGSLLVLFLLGSMLCLLCLCPLSDVFCVSGMSILDCPSIFSNVYLSIIQHTFWLSLCNCQFIIKETLERDNCTDQLLPRLYEESGDYRFPICHIFLVFGRIIQISKFYQPK